MMTEAVTTKTMRPEIPPAPETPPANETPITKRKTPKRTFAPVRIEWRTLSLRMAFNVPLCGGVPRDDAVVERWLTSRMPPVAPAEAKAISEVAEERKSTTDPIPTLDEEMARVWVGFSRDERGLFIRGANVRAHLKSGATVVGQYVRETQGLFGWRARFVDRVYVFEERVYVREVGGDIFSKPSGYRDAAMHVKTAQGPRTCLKRVDFVEAAVIECTIQLLESNGINRDSVVACLEYGRVQGFGQDRTLQFGRYTYELGE